MDVVSNFSEFFPISKYRCAYPGYLRADAWTEDKPSYVRYPADKPGDIGAPIGCYGITKQQADLHIAFDRPRNSILNDYTVSILKMAERPAYSENSHKLRNFRTMPLNSPGDPVSDFSSSVDINNKKLQLSLKLNPTDCATLHSGSGNCPTIVIDISKFDDEEVEILDGNDQVKCVNTYRIESGFVYMLASSNDRTFYLHVPPSRGEAIRVDLSASSKKVWKVNAAEVNSIIPDDIDEKYYHGRIESELLRNCAKFAWTPPKKASVGNLATPTASTVSTATTAPSSATSTFAEMKKTFRSLRLDKSDEPFNKDSYGICRFLFHLVLSSAVSLFGSCQ